MASVLVGAFLRICLLILVRLSISAFPSPTSQTKGIVFNLLHDILLDLPFYLHLTGFYSNICGSSDVVADI